jgi:hypothetical protein
MTLTYDTHTPCDSIYILVLYLRLKLKLTLKSGMHSVLHQVVVVCDHEMCEVFCVPALMLFLG